jgi:membrane-associated phospholipid phosphatase
MRILPLGLTDYTTRERRFQQSRVGGRTAGGLGSGRVRGLWRKALLVGYLLRLLVPGLRKKGLLLVSGALLLWVAFSRVRRRRRRDEIEAEGQWLKEEHGRPPPVQGVA